MSDKEEAEKSNESPDEYKMPEGIPAPPLPKPDSFDLKDLNEGSSQTYSKKIGKGKKEGKKERSHPPDLYNKSREANSGGGKGKACGCLGCLGVIFLLICAAVGGLFYYCAGDLMSQGYKVVRLSPGEQTLNVSPTEPTFYVGTMETKVSYNVANTEAPIAILAGEITVSGDFLEEASFRAVKVTGKENARFAKELNIIAAEFKDEGVTIRGNLTGRVIQNK